MISRYPTRKNKAKTTKQLIDLIADEWLDGLMDKIERALPWVAVPLAAYVITWALFIIWRVGK